MFNLYKFIDYYDLRIVNLFNLQYEYLYMEPRPNHELLTEMDCFDEEGNYTDTHYALHIPCVNRSIGQMLTDLIPSTYDMIIDSEFSSDDGGHVMFVFETEDNYYDLAKSIAIDARKLRESSTDNYDYNKLNIQNTIRSKSTKNKKENLRYIH